MGRVVGGALAAVLVLAVVVIVRAFGMTSRQMEVSSPPPLVVDAEAVAGRLAASIRYRTVSHFDPTTLDEAAFRGLHRFLESSYPEVHRVLRRETVADWSLLYTWPGRDPSLAPVLFLAHSDVVPVAAPDEWTHPAYEGVIADGFVWGRGAMDDKDEVIVTLEAVEGLLTDGFVPERTLMLAYGHDEEVGGRGAIATAALLAERGIRPELVLDEGMAVIDGVMPGVERPLAFVGVAEKGYMSVALEVRAAGGHSSTPPPHTAVGVLARAVQRVEEAPLPARLDGVAGALFDHVGPEMPFAYRLAVANRWLFGGLLKRFLEGNPGTNAAVRTTTAVTMIEGSPKDNVLPSRARAVVNFRILPGDTPESVLAHVRRAVDDPQVTVEAIGNPSSASPVSPLDSPDLERLQATIAEVFPGAIFAPSLVLGGTDSRHYTGVSDDVYRFAPFRYGPGDLPRNHGIDERVAVDQLGDAVRFYRRLIERTCGAG